MNEQDAHVFNPYPKTPRLFRETVLSEKLDGTNSQIFIGESGEFIVGSRTRWITPGKTTDNYGFAAWCYERKEELLKLGPGRHYGEFWGGGIQRGYGLAKDDKRFSLFNVERWQDNQTKTDIRTGEVTVLTPRPKCCEVVPVLYRGPFCTEIVAGYANALRATGSHAVLGYMKPEGLVVFHTTAQRCFKVLLENDEGHKGE